MRTSRARLLLGLVLAVAALAPGCKGPEVASPLTGTSRYLCCNLYYPKTRIPDLAWQVGTKVPLGTRVQIERVRRNSVDFTPEGHPTLTIEYKYGDETTPFETYLDRLFVERDPHAKLKKLAAKRAAAIEQGVVEPGMTKDQVLMARGLPPGHRTPSLESPTWTYWQNRWDTMVVYFVGDKVDRIGR
jgi:hypothetical protein